MRVLIIEDDVRISNNIKIYLSKHLYACDQSMSAEDALTKVFVEDYDTIILDWMLPQMSGPELIKEIRSQKLGTPIILLTAKNQLEDKIEGLGVGADDYLTKPFEMAELLARVKALVRRKFDHDRNPIIKINDLVINTDNCQVKRGNKIIELSPKLYSILEYLAVNKDQVLNRTQIMDHVWGNEIDPFSNTIDVHIRYLRQRIDEPFKQKLIKTIKGKGYMLCSS